MIDLSPGSSLGPYQISALLGKGGMGEVYRAKDTRLGREVALKVLPDQLRDDPELRERLEQEARAISQLQHPNICTLYDIGDQEGVGFLVMELLEGESLQERLSRGALPMREALDLAPKIAGAVDRAHRSGIVHRDLKPGNVMLTPDGPKVLDFGLAKAIQPAAVSVDSASPTALLTTEGMIVGTLSYMAPEQLEGKLVDVRTDVFAFGCLLFEMLTGERAYQGESQASLIAAILERDTGELIESLDDVPGMTPPLASVVERCLAKSPERRWQSLGDVQALLEELPGWTGGPSSTEPNMTEPDSAQSRRPGVTHLMVGLAALMAGLVVGRLSAPAPEGEIPPLTQVVLERPLVGGLEQISNPALSHDGRMVTFLGGTPTGSSLYLRRLDELESRPLEGTEGAGWARFSHDGQWIAYFDVVGRRILKVSIHGGEPEILAEPGYLPFDWRADGTLYYPARGGNRTSESAEALGITRLPPDSEAPKPLTRAEIGDSGRLEVHSAPTLLPGEKLLMARGDGFLQSGWKTGVVDLESGEWLPLVSGANQAQFALDHLILWRNDQLWVARFDSGNAALLRPPRPVLEGVGQHPFAPLEVGEYHVGQDGSLVYIRTAAQNAEISRLVRAPLSNLSPSGGGASEGLTMLRDERIMELALSPDQRHLALARCIADQERRLDRDDPCGVWVFDLATDEWTQMSAPGEGAGFPAWDPSDGALIYASVSPGEKGPRLVRHRFDGSRAVPLTDAMAGKRLIPAGITPEGVVVATELNRDARTSRLLTVAEGTGIEYRILDRTDLLATDLSRDGRWLLLNTAAGEARSELYLLDLENPSVAPRQLTFEGGQAATFSPNEETIFYRSGAYPGAAEILSAEIDLDAARLGAAQIVASTRSVNVSYWRSLGTLAATDEGVISVTADRASASGDLVWIENWLPNVARQLEE